jgi:hypothetical protein
MNNIFVFDLIILIYESISSNKGAEEHLIIPIAGSTTKFPAKKNIEPAEGIRNQS